MIAEILSQSFLTSWLDPVEQALRDLVDETSDPDRVFSAALSGLDQVRNAGLNARSHGPGSGRRSAPRGQSIEDEHSFFSRGAVMSLLQSAIEERIEDAHPHLIVETSLGGRRAGSQPPSICDRRLELSRTRAESNRRLFGPFESSDFRWIAEFGLAKALRALRDRHPFNPDPAPPVKLAEDARLVMVGDWGSGLPGAQRVAHHMRAEILRGIEDRRQVHAIHLGDVYYSGLPREYRNRFLPFWPVDPTEADSVYSWSLNGNHDMYSGGHGYFGTLLGDPRFACQAGSSWFSLENEHWRVVGLDTAWDEEGLVHDPRTERGLAEPQAIKLQQWAEADQRPFMLLSHHPLFSAYEETGPYLREKLSPLLHEGRVKTWFWGHEHKCVVYGPYGGVEHARCIGHGGVPVSAVKNPVQAFPGIKWLEQRSTDGSWERWALLGYAVADFAGPVITVRYMDENGSNAYTETINAHAPA